jgi:hypothetical protein
MYNTTLTITYQSIDGDMSDTTYRKQLLAFVNLSEYTDNVTTKIEQLFDTHKDNIHIKQILPVLKTCLQQRWPFEMDDKTIFIFLFSFDYFYLTYPFICTLIKETTTPLKLIEPIISKINSNIKTK